MHRLLLATFCLLLLWLPALHAADPVAEVTGFSVFPSLDLEKLAKGDLLSTRGAPSALARQLSIQSCYVVNGTPARAMEALQQWNPAKHRELKILLHADLPGSPKPGDFAGLGSAPANGTLKSLAAATEKLSPELQISREEAKKLSPGGGGKEAFPEPLRAFWAELLAGRAQLFASGGAARQPAYDHAAEIRPGEEFATLLGGQDKVRKQFTPFLSESGLTGGKPSLKEELYYELTDVGDLGVLTLGAFATKPVGAGFQAADILYYASGGYYVVLTVYQMWPVEIGGQASTLVWRGDFVSASSLGSLRGLEKLASAGAMMKDIAKAITFLKRDTAGAR